MQINIQNSQAGEQKTLTLISHFERNKKQVFVDLHDSRSVEVAFQARHEYFS